MAQYFYGILAVFTRAVLGIIIAYLVLKLSRILFEMDITTEIQSGNKAAAFFGMGLLILIGLIIGLTRF